MSVIECWGARSVGLGGPRNQFSHTCIHDYTPVERNFHTTGSHAARRKYAGKPSITVPPWPCILHLSCAMDTSARGHIILRILSLYVISLTPLFLILISVPARLWCLLCAMYLPRQESGHALSRTRFLSGMLFGSLDWCLLPPLPQRSNVVYRRLCTPGACYNRGAPYFVSGS